MRSAFAGNPEQHLPAQGRSFHAIAPTAYNSPRADRSDYHEKRLDVGALKIFWRYCNRTAFFLQRPIQLQNQLQMCNPYLV